MQSWIMEMMDQYGYLGIFLLITIENVFPPIPSEVILTFGGFMTTYSRMQVWPVILAATFGAVAGAVILYGIGYLFPTESLKKLLSGRIGKLLKLTPDHVTGAEQWFISRGKSAAFFCRFIPIVRSLISIPAGMAKMNMAEFLILTTAGSFIWNTVLVWLGAIAGASWERVTGCLDRYGTMVTAIAVSAALATIFMKLKKKEQ